MSPQPWPTGWLWVQVAADLPNAADPSWVDVSADVRTVRGAGEVFANDYGRGRESERASAGTAALRLDNRERAYDPQVNPDLMRPVMLIKAEALVDGSWRPLFRGHVETIRTTTTTNLERLAEVKPVDALAWFATEDVTVDRPAEPSGARVNAVLDAVGWPEALRDVDDGQVTVNATDPDPLPGEDPEPVTDRALNLLNTAVEAEDGVLYITPAGVVRFTDRHHRLSIAAQDTFTGEVYAEHQGTWDLGEIVNVGRAERADGSQVAYVDDDSAALYGRQPSVSYDVDASLVENEVLAQWAVFRYAGAHERIDAVEVVCTDDGMLARLLDLTIGSRVTVNRRWPDGSVDTQDSVVEGIGHAIPSGRVGWVVTLNLSPHWGDEDWAIFAEDDEDDVPGFDEGLFAP